MRLRQTFAPIFAIGVLGMALALAGCGDQAASSSADAKSQFLLERGGGGTPGAVISGTVTTGGPGPGIFGSVVKVDSTAVTIKSSIDGSETVVELATGGKVYKQAQGPLSDIKVGDTVTASGTKSGDTIEAQVIQLGDGLAGAMGGGFVPGGGYSGTPGVRSAGAPGAFPGGTPRARAQGTPQANGQGRQRVYGTPGVQGNFVSGTVEKIDGDTITVKTREGSTSSFKMTGTTRVQKQVEIGLADIKEGDTLTASGQKNGDKFEATTIQVVEPQVVPVPTP